MSKLRLLEILWSGVGAGISLHLLVMTAELQWELGGKSGVRLLYIPAVVLR